MKAVLTINDKKQLQTMLGKKPFILRLPDFKKKDSINKKFYLLALAFFLLIIITPTLTYNIGKNEGLRTGANIGYETGYNVAVREYVNAKDMTLNEALAWNLRLHLDKYISWFGIVVGVAWIIHGVGFHIVKL